MPTRLVGALCWLASLLNPKSASCRLWLGAPQRHVKGFQIPAGVSRSCIKQGRYQAVQHALWAAGCQHARAPHQPTLMSGRGLPSTSVFSSLMSRLLTPCTRVEHGGKLGRREPAADCGTMGSLPAAQSRHSPRKLVSTLPSSRTMRWQ